MRQWESCLTLALHSANSRHFKTTARPFVLHKESRVHRSGLQLCKLSCKHRVEQLEKQQDLICKALEPHHAVGKSDFKCENKSALQFLTSVIWASILSARWPRLSLLLQVGSTLVPPQSSLNKSWQYEVKCGLLYRHWAYLSSYSPLPHAAVRLKNLASVTNCVALCVMGRRTFLCSHQEMRAFKFLPESGSQIYFIWKITKEDLLEGKWLLKDVHNTGQ